MAQSSLSLTPVSRTKVFRAIDTILRADPILKGLFRPGSFRSWQGVPEDTKEFGLSQAPAIRLTPASMGPDRWYDPASQEGDLLIIVELLVRGTNVDDVSNLWGAIQSAIYPGGSGSILTTANTLQSAGSFSGLITFQEPAYDIDAAHQAGYFHAVGRMKVDVINLLNQVEV